MSATIGTHLPSRAADGPALERLSVRLGGLRAVVTAIPPEHRAAVMAPFHVVAYASLSVPAVLAGILVTHISLQGTFEIFGSAVAAIALVVALEAWRTRPTRHRVGCATRAPAPARP